MYSRLTTLDPQPFSRTRDTAVSYHRHCYGALLSFWNRFCSDEFSSLSLVAGSISPISRRLVQHCCIHRSQEESRSSVALCCTRAKHKWIYIRFPVIGKFTSFSPLLPTTEWWLTVEWLPVVRRSVLSINNAFLSHPHCSLFFPKHTKVSGACSWWSRHVTASSALHTAGRVSFSPGSCLRKVYLWLALHFHQGEQSACDFADQDTLQCSSQPSMDRGRVCTMQIFGTVRCVPLLMPCLCWWRWTNHICVTQIIWSTRRSLTPLPAPTTCTTVPAS